MKQHIVLALLALNLVSCLAAPQNNVELVQEEKTAVGTVSSKDYQEELSKYQNDALLSMCNGKSCSVMSAGEAKGLDYSSIRAMFPLKGDAALARALAPSVDTVLESVKGMDAQKARLEKLRADMESLSALFDKGSQASQARNTQYASMMSKGVVLPAAPPTKAYAAALPPSKGAFAAPSSKGYSAASSMQLEASMCPMTMYELGKTQKLYAETKVQLQTANTMNAVLMKEKADCENAKAIAEMGKLKAEQQAAFNAKYAAEQKNRADRLELELAQANSEKEALKRQKAALEAALSSTQAALAQEKQTSASLTEALKSCNEDKAQLEDQKAALIQELSETQDTLRQTQRALETEQFEHARTQRELEATKVERDAIEVARRQLEVAKQQLEDELAETKTQLETMTAERDQLQVTLDATSASLAKCNEEKMQCNADLAQEKTLTAMLTTQLSDAMTLLTEEKKLREQLNNLLMQVKATAEALEEEVKKLQMENAVLTAQLLKLKSEQEVALAMAAGCPPTYEKFGTSCYKYVREKTQWKMAQEQCMKDGGNLVSIESRQEQAYIVDYLKRFEARFDDKYVHLGAYDYHAKGVFKWVSSVSPIELGETFWLPNNPRGMGRRCLAIQTHDMDMFGQWADEYCWAPLPFVCEMVTFPF